MRIIVWLIRAALFFSLFAFALNNQHEASLKWFFSQQWRAPMVFIVLAAFTLGCVVGGLAVAPSWWKHRKLARSRKPAADALNPAEPVTTENLPLDSHPARHGV
ncbi:MAG: hypothetical protein RLZZ618_1706 [Pseudomonadota bacterium]|jgi:uncharacterized integral membrane protein